MGANMEAFANGIRKIGFWNLESRIVAVRQREHFRVATLTTAAAVSLSFYRPDDDENDDDDDVGVRRKDVENKNFMLYVIDDVSSKCCESKPSRDEQVFNKQKR